MDQKGGPDLGLSLLDGDPAVPTAHTPSACERDGTAGASDVGLRDVFATLTPEHLTRELRSQNVIGADARVTGVRASGAALDGVKGAQQPPKKLDITYSPEGAGPKSMIVKQLCPPEDAVDEMKTVGARCGVYCFLCGPCMGICHCIPFCMYNWLMTGKGAYCISSKKAIDDCFIRNWDFSEYVRPEYTWFELVQPLCAQRCPEFNTPRAYSMAWFDAGALTMHTWSFVTQGAEAGSHGFVVMEDLSDSGWVGSYEHTLVAPSGGKMITSHPRYEPGISEKKLEQLPSVDAIIRAFVLSLVTLHAAFWDDHETWAAANLAAVNWYQFMPFFLPHRPTWMAGNQSAAAAFSDGFAAKYLEAGLPFSREDPLVARINEMGTGVDQFRTEPIMEMLHALENGRDSLYNHVVHSMNWKQTLVRGDAHVGNSFLRTSATGAIDVCHFDFANFGPSNVAAEVLYAVNFSKLWSCGFFSTTAFNFEDELQLLKDYHSALVQKGVSGYDFADLFRDYKALALYQCGSVVQTNILRAKWFTPKVRNTPSRPRSWANFSLLYLYFHRNAWANITPFSPKCAPYKDWRFVEQRVSADSSETVGFYTVFCGCFGGWGASRRPCLNCLSLLSAVAGNALLGVAEPRGRGAFCRMARLAIGTPRALFSEPKRYSLPWKIPMENVP
jgi:hypothetical protein